MGSVRVKLLGAFAAVLVLVVVLGANGMTQLKKLNDFTGEVVSVWMYGIEEINQISLNTERFENNYYQTLIANNPEEVKKLNEISNGLVRDIDEGIKRYEITIESDEDRNHYEVMRTAWGTFHESLEITTAANSSKEDVDNATEAAGKAFVELQNAIKELMAYNHEGAVNSDSESDAIYNKTISMLFYLGIAIFLVVVLLAVVLTLNLTRPLKATTQIMNRIAVGDLTVDLLRVNRKDEFGVMMEAVNKTLLALRTSVKQMQDSSTSIAAASTQLYASSQQNSEAARHVSEAIGQVAIGSEEQANTATECGRVIDEMADGVQRIAETTGEVAELSQQASGRANDGAGTIGDVSDRMKRLTDSVEQASQTILRLEEQSGQISDISAAIGDIAYRTNLLALNAGIEAARAGEHGKGFAVVAGEVRKLATQSDESAKGIIELIEIIQKDTVVAAEAMRKSLAEVHEGVIAVDHAEQAFKEIVVSTGEVSTRVQEAAAAAEQLAASSEEVAASISNMGHIARQTAGMSQQVAASTEEQLASSEEMTQSSQTLSGISKDMQTLVRTFKL
ncbi:methyl-accepting chemotaxis protein [Cohnella terricola]|uniref:Methyl-accepting chemotaxis protein n=1 Tax=Cohnella terricola TaxID=1289167 RepID=A0A559JR23_9BACL|nr:methyl-accepting chemotaxis protein [Cohnella terricola]TVY02329.1 methyl-accepting chemotaxis protein [Cohnella terricola]